MSTGRPERTSRRDASGSFLSRHRTIIVALTLLGACLGILASIIVPAQYRSEVGVLITVLGDPERPVAEILADEAELVNDIAVRDRVRGAVPDAPDRVDVEVDADQQILLITASADTPDTALRLARSWSSAYIDARGRAVAARLGERIDEIEAELSGMVTQIGTARLAGDDAEAARLEAVRSDLTSEQAELENDLGALSSGGAEIVQSPDRPSGRSGVAVLPAALLGALIAGLLGALIGVARDRRKRQEAEAEEWLDAPTFEPIDLVELADQSSHEQVASLDDLAPPAPPAPVAVSTPDSGLDTLGPSIFGSDEAPEPTPDEDVESVAAVEPSESPHMHQPAASIQPSVHAVPAAPVQPSTTSAPTSPQPATGAPEPLPLLDLTSPTVTINLTTPAATRTTGPTDWLHDPVRSAGRTRVPTSSKVRTASVRVVDLARPEHERLLAVDDWVDDLSLLPD